MRRYVVHMRFTVLEFMFYDWSFSQSLSPLDNPQASFLLVLILKGTRKKSSPPAINNVYEVSMTILTMSEHSGETALARF